MSDPRRIVLLAHEQFPDRSKTANGVLRYGRDEVVAVLDRDRAGEFVADHLDDVPDVPIVADFEAALAAGGEGGVDALVIGIAPIGGGFEESWRPDVRAAIEAGADVVAGLHHFLNDDPELASLAADHGVDLVDVRDPPDDLGVADGRVADLDAEVVLTVGTDCSVGKMTTTAELVAAARAAGIDAAFVPTGQTGVMIEGWGIAVDRVVADFAAGAVERLVVEAAADHDVVVVEGQGSVVHPAYSGVTTSILHGAAPEKLVLCHEAGREAVHGYESTALPPVPGYVDRYEALAAPVSDATVVAGSLNTAGIDRDDDARDAVEAFGAALDAPAADPVRFDADELAAAVWPERVEADDPTRPDGGERRWR